MAGLKAHDSGIPGQAINGDLRSAAATPAVGIGRKSIIVIEVIGIRSATGDRIHQNIAHALELTVQDNRYMLNAGTKVILVATHLIYERIIRILAGEGVIGSKVASARSASDRLSVVISVNADHRARNDHRARATRFTSGKRVLVELRVEDACIFLSRAREGAVAGPWIRSIARRAGDQGYRTC